MVTTKVGMNGVSCRSHRMVSVTWLIWTDMSESERYPLSSRWTTNWPSNLTLTSTQVGLSLRMIGHLNGWKAVCDSTAPVSASQRPHGTDPYEVMDPAKISLKLSSVFIMKRLQWYPVVGDLTRRASDNTLILAFAFVKISSSSHPWNGDCRRWSRWSSTMIDLSPWPEPTCWMWGGREMLQALWAPIWTKRAPFFPFFWANSCWRRRRREAGGSLTWSTKFRAACVTGAAVEGGTGGGATWGCSGIGSKGARLNFRSAGGSSSPSSSSSTLSAHGSWLSTVASTLIHELTDPVLDWASSSCILAGGNLLCRILCWFAKALDCMAWKRSVRERKCDHPGPTRTGQIELGGLNTVWLKKRDQIERKSQASMEKERQRA